MGMIQLAILLVLIALAICILAYIPEGTSESWLYHALKNANNQLFVNSLPPSQLSELMRIVAKNNIQECVCCPFFVAKNETCTLGTPDPDWNKKPEDCKLNRQE